MSIPSVAQFLLPRTVREFGQLYPHVRLDVHDLPDRQLADQIRAGLGDVAIQTLGFEDDGCRSLSVLHDPLRWVGRAGHPLGSKTNLDVEHMRSEPFILLRKGSVFREMMEPLIQREFVGARFIEVDQPSTLLSMVSMGLGAALLPAMFCPADGSVISRQWARDSIARTVILTRPPGRALMPAQKEFVRFMLGQLVDGAIELPQGVRRLTVSDSERESFLADT